MKCIIAIAIVTSILALAGCSTPQTKNWKRTYSSFDLPSEHHARDNAAQFSFEYQGIPLEDVLKLYEKVSERSVIVGQPPSGKINLRSARPLNRIEALQLLDTVLAQKRIDMVLAGDNAVKAVPAERVQTESPPEITLPWQLLPESSSPMSRTVHVQHFKPSEIVPVLQPYANLPNSILPIDSQQMLVLRDYSSNIRQQLKLLEELEQKQTSK